MKVILLLLAGIIKCGWAHHVVVLGNTSPPATVGPNIPIFPFYPDPWPLFASTNTVPSGFPSGEQLTLSPTCSHRKVGQGWGLPTQWGHGYTGDVYWTGGTSSLEISLPSSTAAFAFYVQPNVWTSFLFTITYKDGLSIEETIDGNPGNAEGFAVFEHDSHGSPTGVVISTIDSAQGFAVGEFHLGMNAPPVARCQPPVTLPAGANCQAYAADINNGSNDSDTANGDLTIVQTPQASSPLPIGETSVELTASDGTLSASCTTMVTVTSQAPIITPLQESTVLAGGSVPLSVTAFDPDGQYPLTYQWDASACPGAAIADASAVTPTLSIAAGTSPGRCQVSITVCDFCGSARKCTLASGPVSLTIYHHISPLSHSSWISSHLFFVCWFQQSFFCIVD